jgi:predicted P-loop ATPase
MASMNKADVDSLKAFISKRVDRARLAFERRAADFPRQCIFIGTTNLDEYLKDETGARRYWPVKITDVTFEKLKNDKDQLWAEALELYRAGEKLYIDDDATISEAKKEQAARYMHDAWEDDVQEWLNRPDNHEKNFTGITLNEIWRGVFGQLDGMKFNRSEQMRLSKILKVLGYQCKILKRDGKTVRVYKNENYDV